MRLALIGAVVAFIVGLALADYTGRAGACECRALALVALALACASRDALRGVFALLAVASLGAAAMADAFERAGQPLASRLETVVDARVSERIAGAGRVVIRADQVIGPDGTPVPPAIRLWVEPESPLARIPRGDAFRAAVELHSPRPASNPGGRGRDRALARRGVGAAGTLRHPAFAVSTVPRRNRMGLRQGIEEIRQRSLLRLRERGQGGALLAALALGDRSGLAAETRAAAARGGVAHLLAVSGLHLALVAGGAALLFGRLFRWRGLSSRFDTRRLAFVGALVVGAGYALASGAPVSMQRAFAFLAVLGIAGMLRRTVGGYQRLGLAAGFVVFSEPAVIFEPAAQLSFVATSALILAPPVGAELAPGLRRRALELLGASAAASLATAPLVALHFGTTSSFGWFANLIAIPLTAVLLLPLALASALIEAADFSALGWLVEFAVFLAEGCLAASEAWAAALPAAGSVAPGPLGWWLSVGVALFGVTRSRLWLRALAAAACGAVLTGAPVADLDPPIPRVVFLDVGWGDAIVVQGRSGALLVDAGGAFEGYDAGRSIVLPALARLGVERLDALVVTHRDRDHSGGIVSVLGGIPIDELWLPYGAGSDPALSELLAAAGSRTIPIRELGAASPRLERGDLRIEPLWPLAESRTGGNADSLVLRVELAGAAFLLTGDLEAPGERALLGRGANLSVDLLKLGHHGSRTSSHEAFLRAVAPRWSVVSAPEAGRLAFPHRSVLERVRALDIGLAWTGRDGAVLVGLEPFSVAGWRSGGLARNPAQSDRLGSHAERNRDGHRP